MEKSDGIHTKNHSEYLDLTEQVVAILDKNTVKTWCVTDVFLFVFFLSFSFFPFLSLRKSQRVTIFPNSEIAKCGFRIKKYWYQTKQTWHEPQGD